LDFHALTVLEFPRVVELVAARATSDAGLARVRALAPVTDRDWLETEHARVAAVRALRGAPGGWGPEPVPLLGQALAKLDVIGASWTPEEAQRIRVVLVSAQRTISAVRDPRRPAAAVAVLMPLIDVLAALPDLIRAIDRAIGDDGTVRDDATPLLRRLRKELRGAEQDLVRIIEQAMARLEPHQQVPDASVTIRNGRYVMPVRRDARAAVGGIVHDTSATGATLFVEPPAAIEKANQIREMEIDAQREVDRILLELTDLARPQAAAIDASHGALSELDSLYARAKYADEFSCTHVTIADAGSALVVREGRHPLLAAQGAAVVPFDLSMDRGERTLLVSGPNTGGKTVLLKALGLLHVMAQSGLPVPAGAGTALPMIDNVFADVGDEQSIEASLSTFSAHLRNLRAILQSATPESLVLIDELGSGTDPAEGAALGAAVLEELTSRGSRTLATTHLGALKDLPLTVPGIVNASLQFDDVQLAPTYRLQLGIPGRSYGLQIARRLDLPAAVLARAEARVPEQERAVSALLAELEQRDRALADREAVLRADEASAQEHGRRVADRERAVRDRERDVERQARAEARRYLLEARAEVERTIAAVRAAADADREERERAARQVLERRAQEHAHALDSLGSDRSPMTHPARASTADAPAVGDPVEVESLGAKVGRLVEWRGDDAVVVVGSLKVTVPAGSVRRAAREHADADTSSVRLGDVPEHDAKPEVDLRGVRAGAVDELLLSAVDAAVRADLRTLRIIHGKGTGALRDRVGELLRKDVRVKAFRLGAWNEGGAGVTVAELA
jgi:DNA mismatch repair protein MutS2